jgi:alkaline phosphatase
MGAGHPDYDDDGKKTADKEYKYVGGEDVWKKLKAGEYGQFIDKRKRFRKYMVGDTPDRVIGVAQVRSTLQCGRSFAAGDNTVDYTEPFQQSLIDSVPTLEEMTAAAINVLDENEKGFIIMVEGGAVDWAAHANNLPRMIEEQIDFIRSVEYALHWVAEHANWDEVLFIVTADHETGYLTTAESGSARDVPTNDGIGTLPKYVFNSGSHTNHLVPLFAEGKAAQGLLKRAKGVDSVRGQFLDNTDIANYIFKLLGN